MHAIILAGGFGTRLRSVVSDVPKPLALIGGRPFLAWLIDLLAQKGFGSVTLSVHHDWQKIRDYFFSYPAHLSINYAIEEKPLGTGGAISYALSEYKSEQPVFVLNGDSFVKVDYKKLYDQHIGTKAKLTMVIREVSDVGRYGQVVEKNGIITSFSQGVAGKPGVINAGVYVMQPDLFSSQEASEAFSEAFSFEQDFLPQKTSTIKPRSFKADDYFIDIGIPEDYVRACMELPDILGAG